MPYMLYDLPSDRLFYRSRKMIYLKPVHLHSMVKF